MVQIWLLPTGNLKQSLEDRLCSFLFFVFPLSFSRSFHLDLTFCFAFFTQNVQHGLFWRRFKPDEIRMPQGTNHKNQRVGGHPVHRRDNVLLAKNAASLASMGWLHGNWLHCPLIFDFSKTSTEKTSTNTGLKPKHWVGLLGSTITTKKYTSLAEQSRLSQTHWWSPATLTPGIIGKALIAQKHSELMNENKINERHAFKNVGASSIFSTCQVQNFCRTFWVTGLWDSYTLKTLKQPSTPWIASWWPWLWD